MATLPEGPRIDPMKLRLKIGGHEFEAEGPSDLVGAHLETWKSLAGFGPPPDPAPAAGKTPSAEPREAEPPKAAAPQPDTAARDAAIRQLFAVDAEHNLISLRVSPNSLRRNSDVGLLLLYGFGTLLGEGVDGAEVAPARLDAAFTASGRRLKRVDRAIARHLATGLIRRGGPHKHPTYTLTVTGQQRAVALARQLAGASGKS